MRTDNIKMLLEKYYAGETTLEEEEQLRSALESTDSLPEELQADAELFTMMSALSQESTEKEIEFSESTTRIVQLVHGISKMRLSWVARIAAGLSLLVVGMAAGWILGRDGTESTDIAGLRQDMNEMNQLIALSQLRKESASERIMATYEFKKLDSASDEILDALIYTFQNDKNANVKNAAAEALFKFGNQDKVRKAFISGLSNPSDPVLQIKLIDMLVRMDEKRALPKLQEIIQEEAQMKVVKQKAAQGIGKLL